jgi:hypothetical protein
MKAETGNLKAETRIKLTADNHTEQRILDYLLDNASDVLIEKINTGKKTLAGAVRYATAEAKKKANGESCVCVDDATVFGWIVHFFEEDDIAEPKKEKARGAVRTPSGVKEKTPKEAHAAWRKKTNPEKPLENEKPKGPIFLELFSSAEMSGGKK